MREPTKPPPQPHRRRGWLWALLATLTMLVMLTIAAVVVWRLLDDGRIRRWEELAALPEATLYYPGSVQISAAGRDYEVSLFGRANALYDQTLGADASAEEVRAFYGRELAKRGWMLTNGGPPEVATPNMSGRGWRKGQLRQSLTFDPAVDGTGFRTVYRLDISANPLSPTPTATR